MKSALSRISVMVSFLLIGGISISDAQSYDDDLYGTHETTTKTSRDNGSKARKSSQATTTAATASAAETAVSQPKTLKDAESYAKSLELQFYGTEKHPESAVVANDYDSAMQRRMEGMSSDTYQLPESYYKLKYSDSYQYAKTYDPEYYNVMVSGDQVWVEPKYITSMFGTWGAAVVIEVHHWYYGWDDPYYFYWWGYPHYSWVDWYWGFTYDPFWGWGFSWGWGWPGWRPYGPWGPHPWGPRPWGPYRPYPGGHWPGPHPAHPGYVRHTPAHVSPSQRGGMYYSGGGGRGGVNSSYGRGGSSYSSHNADVNSNVSRGYTTRNSGNRNNNSGRNTNHNYYNPSTRGSNYSRPQGSSYNRSGGYGGGGGYHGGSYGGGHMGGGRGGRR